MADTLTDEEIEARRAKQIEDEMRSQGVPTEENVYDDYFGFDETQRVTLPDGKSWVDFKVMTEGERRKYLNKQNRSIRIKKATGDAEMAMAPGDERYHLLTTVLVNWDLRDKNGDPVPFNKQNVERFLENANPRVVDLIEKEVRKAHPWLMAELSLEDIDQEIANLQELRATLEKEKSGN